MHTYKKSRKSNQHIVGAHSFTLSSASTIASVPPTTDISICVDFSQLLFFLCTTRQKCQNDDETTQKKLYKFFRSLNTTSCRRWKSPCARQYVRCAQSHCEMAGRTGSRTKMDKKWNSTLSHSLDAMLTTSRRRSDEATIF